MSDEEFEPIDAIVVGFDEAERILASPTSPLELEKLASFIGLDALYEDYNGNIWRGKVVDTYGDTLVVVFEELSQLPPGLGQGSLLKLPAKALRQ
ncbi:MAG: hypothetical protein QXO86_06875 [Nitrososphaerota archaeon]